MTETLNGACLCGHVRFHLSGGPIVTHACHCTQCQRVTGTVDAGALRPAVGGAAIRFL